MSDVTLLPPGATQAGTLGEYRGAAGRTLRYRLVAAEKPRFHILYLHGIESHGTWFLPAAWKLRERGCTTWLLDRRGSGLNRDPFPGHAPSAKTLLEDVRAFRREIGVATLNLVGLSWGGKLACASALDDPSGVGSLILVTPGLRALVDLSPAQKLRLLAGLLVGGKNRLPVPIEPEMFTRTPEFLQFIKNDPWRLKRATAGFFWSGRTLDRIIARDIRRLRIPVLLFLAGGERIIDNQGVIDLLSPLPKLTTRTYPEATHSIQFDQVDTMVDDMIHFLERECAA